MRITKDLERILLSVNLKTDMNIMITDQKTIMYYMGNSDECGKYLYSEISDELKKLIKGIEDTKTLEGEDVIKLMKDDDATYSAQSFSKLIKGGRFNKCIICYKNEKNFTEEELLMIKSSIYLIEKYFN